MNTPKRKFNALLNSLGNRSTTSLSSKSPEINNGSVTNFASELETDSLVKKRRTGRPVSAVGQNLLRSTSSIIASTTDSIVHKKSASVASGQPVTLEAPKYAPWDRAAFLERLRTFSNITDWTPKPAKVNEVEWAKRGWVNKKWERVRCELCNIEILVKLNIREVDGKEERVLNPWDMGTIIPVKRLIPLLTFS
jgi:C3HC zinc finger-like